MFALTMMNFIAAISLEQSESWPFDIEFCACGLCYTAVHSINLEPIEEYRHVITTKLSIILFFCCNI